MDLCFALGETSMWVVFQLQKWYYAHEIPKTFVQPKLFKGGKKNQYSTGNKRSKHAN